MRAIFHRIRVNCLILSSLLIATSACGTTGGLEQETKRWAKTQTELLRQAGERLGVPVRVENLAQLTQPGATLITAPAVGLEEIPATELPRGVNIGVAYVDAPGQSYPPGIYALRAFAEPRQAGTVEGRLQLVDTGGRVAAELPATIDVQSLTVPPEARLNRTVVSFSSSRRAGSCGPGETCYCCPNGWIVCTGGLGIARATNPR